MAETIDMYVGTYSSPTGNPLLAPASGIYRCAFDTETGKVSVLGVAAEAKNPSFLAKHATLPVYYCVASNEEGSSREGLVIAFKKEADGSLSRINTINSGGLGSCHIATSRDGKYVFVANYSSGQVSFFSVKEDGALDKLMNVILQEGPGMNPTRQERTHAHWVGMDPAGKYLLCCDLGADRIFSYCLNDDKTQWIPNPAQPYAQVSGGAGCRHAAFSPNGRYLYVLNELNCTLDIFRYYPENGKIISVQTVATLPSGYAGVNKAAAIVAHPKLNAVYFSNRGANLVSVVAADANIDIDPIKQESGNLAQTVQNCASIGEFPRFMCLDPTGKFLIVCNKKSNNMVVMRVNQDNGQLEYTSNMAVLPWAVSICF